ncbi:MAG: hypothetical protein GPJ54_04455 [Candidatus Heimdallarchaeota archaeon]|nr:hypothetical protein [Candidatus Heimdallarchaeota archaeon]
MTYTYIYSIISSLAVIIFYGVYTIWNNVIKSKHSLRNQESVHRFILISSGILIGTGIGSQVIVPNGDSEVIDQFTSQGSEILNNSFFFGLLLIFLGLIIGVIGIYYLKFSLWKPLEEISEYSAQFGRSFMATRLPVTGGLELRRFSERFNNNILDLANKISSIEIKADILKNATHSAINSSSNLSSNIARVSENVDSFSQFVSRQENAIDKINNEISNFISWYNETQIRLENQFTEIRSLSETGNMLSVNASIESVNLETQNPGIETIALKLHDLAGSLDSRQDELRTILMDIQTVYTSFSSNVKSELDEISSLSNNAISLTSSIENSLGNLKVNDNEISNSSQNLVSSLDKFITGLPTSY